MGPEYYGKIPISQQDLENEKASEIKSRNNHQRIYLNKLKTKGIELSNIQTEDEVEIDQSLVAVTKDDIDSSILKQKKEALLMKLSDI